MDLSADAWTTGDFAYFKEFDMVRRLWAISASSLPASLRPGLRLQTLSSMEHERFRLPAGPPLRLELRG
jgi:hypothetical protein